MGETQWTFLWQARVVCHFPEDTSSSSPSTDFLKVVHSLFSWLFPMLFLIFSFALNLSFSDNRKIATPINLLRCETRIQHEPQNRACYTWVFPRKSPALEEVFDTTRQSSLLTFGPSAVVWKYAFFFFLTSHVYCLWWWILQWKNPVKFRSST